MSCLAGCTKIERNNVDLSHVKTSQVDDSILKIEVMNIYNDSTLFHEIREQASKELKKVNDSSDSDVVKRKKAGIVISDYISDIYNMSLTRIASDIDTIYTNSEEYMAYIGMLQTFVDEYNQSKDELQEELMKGIEGAQKTSAYKAFYTVESYYVDMVNGLAENQ